MNLYYTALYETVPCYQCYRKLFHILEKENLYILCTGDFPDCSISLSMRSGDIMIIFVNTIEELMKFISLQQIINDYQLILVSAREDAEIRKLAQQLTPRYISSSDSGIEDISAFILNMVNKSSTPPYSKEKGMSLYT